MARARASGLVANRIDYICTHPVTYRLTYPFSQSVIQSVIQLFIYWTESQLGARRPPLHAHVQARHRQDHGERVQIFV